MAKNRVIGLNNRIPWHIPEELQFFKTTTMGHPVVMGRMTFLSIKKPLPGRKNIIISRDEDYRVDGAVTVTTIDDALAACGDAEKAFILGGSEIFILTMDIVDTIILTILDRDVEGDTWFPEFPAKEFKETAAIRHDYGKEPFTVHYYSRIKP